MPQIFTNQINKTINDAAASVANSNTDSLSFRFTAMQEGSYLEVHSIAFGLLLNSTPANVIQGTLLILRNEVFDRNFIYGGVGSQNTPTVKDVVFAYFLSKVEPMKYLPFIPPLKLNDAQNYLVIACGFNNSDVTPPSTVSSILTVRGDVLGPSQILYGKAR